MAYSVEQKLEVILAVERGLTYSEAAAKYGIGGPTIRRWVRRYQNGESLEARPRSGAPPLLKASHLAALRAAVDAQPTSNIEQLTDALETRTGLRASRVTVSRALAKLGLRKVRGKARPAAVADPPGKVGEAPKKARYKAQHRRAPGPGIYPSSLTDHEWLLLRPLFDPDGPRTRGRPRVHGTRGLLNAIFYVIRTGCGWRYLPGDFPPWQTVYAAFRSWSRRGYFEQMHAALAREWRVREGREPDPSAAIIDSQTAKTTEKGGLEVTTAPRESKEESAISS